MQIVPIAHRTLHRCGVCGFAELRTDLVIDREPWLVAECPRCEHRSVRSPGAVRPARAAAKLVREVAPAA